MFGFPWAVPAMGRLHAVGVPICVAAVLVVGGPPYQPQESVRVQMRPPAWSIDKIIRI